ncbi:aminotransferase class V-fold PLP-dependent enzyme [Mariniplasma anaerobium]|uniref:Cysteine desulfurase n=1 Tax=Mariniplasma anaerobium TaxID=2735436 RepID=A0A7U9XVI9_9MOLU|nr:SufS family cysteine desulfurase [Mariniplasma anaerobium]BCR36577.1 cysteine desulfurase [Mariniplasma anaerobium]
MIDVKAIRKDFPIYDREPKLTYLDSAASSLKVKSVIDHVDHYYQALGVNVHRGAYDLAYEATRLYEEARTTVSKFINAQENEIVFTRGTTTSLNMIANAYRDLLKKDDEIIVTELEHHSSILPWMVIAQKTGAVLKYVPLTKEGRITVKEFEKVLTDKTKVVAITYVSNVMGYVTPIKEIIDLAHKKSAVVILDAAQAVPHMAVDVKALDVDYLAFSGHKMFGPSGVGVLFGKNELLNMLQPVEYGGEMADEVFKDHATFKDAPLRFEAGTPVISGAIGLAAAIRYIENIGYDDIHDHTIALKEYTLKKLKELKGITIYNETSDISTITFNVDDIHPHDIATMLDQYQVSVRAGHHCAQLVSRFLGVNSTLRVSFHIYNDFNDCDVLISSLKAAQDFFLAF